MNNLNGILLVVGAMAAFTIEDMYIKQMSVRLPTGQILFILGLTSAIIFASLAYSRGDNLWARQAWGQAAMLRAVAEAIAAITFVTALSLVPISTVAAVFQATPLAITMGAALFMGEQVGWRRWGAIGLGFIGVLLIIRPGLSDFDPSVTIVLITVVAISVRDLATRRVNPSVSSSVVSFQGFGSLVLAGALLMLTPGQSVTAMDLSLSAMMAGGVIFGALGYYGIVTAMRIGDASAVAPFRYTRLLFSLLVGVLVFGESPDALTLTGAALIMGTGFYTFLRERHLARQVV